MVRDLESRMADEGERVVKLCGAGFNCAEAVLTVLSNRMKKLGRDYSRLVPSVATGFGAGIGRDGGTCGALSGVVLALGLMAGRERAEDLEKKYKVYNLVERLIENFEGKFGSSCCRDLIGMDLGSKENRIRFRSQRIHDKVCSQYIKWCVDQGAKLLYQLSEG